MVISGSSGRTLPVMTNYFRLEQAPNWHLYQYHVGFDPELDSKRLRCALLHDHDELLGKTRAFDGMVLYLPKKLPLQVSQRFCSHVVEGDHLKDSICCKQNP